MGLLTDPNAGQGKLIKVLIKYYSKLCILMYIGSLIWFCMLANTSVSIPTYFSENALLPGLVKSEFNEGNTAKQYYKELLDEMKNYQNAVPYPWLLAKFRQIGLDTYSHNFTLNYPLGGGQIFAGRNVYGILRAPRAASTESVVLSVPYRTPSNVHATTAPSIAIMLAFAKFANREKYWSKDIIFLVTEHEQLGVQAWLEAYHSTTCGTMGTLNHGDLRGRAGAIQAAINLEIHTTNIGRIDVKIEGLNGHLPNLDLVTLVNRMCMKEGIQHTFKNRQVLRSTHDWRYSLETMLSMIATQATGVPNGNHGLFHRFGIEAVTLEGFPSQRYDAGGGDLFIVGRILEGLFRSLNNLLERFHQSYFFYLLPSSDRFVSIGLYIPVVMCLAGTLFIKACAHWYRLNTNENIKRKNDNSRDEVPSQNQENNSIDLVRVGVIILLTHTVGICVENAPKLLAQLGLDYASLPTERSVYWGFGLISLLLLLLPVFIPARNRTSGGSKNLHVLMIFANLEMGTALIAIGMMNFSLALFAATLYVPVLLFISPETKQLRLIVQRILMLVVHPFVVMTTLVMFNTYILFPNSDLSQILERTLTASQQALVFSIVDAFIYGNWLYKVCTAILLPNWLCFWFVLFPHHQQHSLAANKKFN